MKASTLALRIWILSSLILDSGLLIYSIIEKQGEWTFCLFAFIPILFGSFPVLVVMAICLPIIRRMIDSYHYSIWLLIFICATCALVYGLVGILLNFSTTTIQQRWSVESFRFGLNTFAVLFCTSLIALFLSKTQLKIYLGYRKPIFLNYKQTNMETQHNEESIAHSRTINRSNKILIKGAVTAALIGVMMIPTVFISNLVQERQDRNEAVVKEVDSRWALAQTVSGPYLFIPYKLNTVDASGKALVVSNHLLILPENKQVTGNINHEIRDRSIYKVLLYRAALNDQGSFVFNLPRGISSDQVQWTDARICFGLSDFKGIEEKLVVRFNGTDNELSPGLPVSDISENGLSAPIAISVADLGKVLSYQMNIKIKGSQMLHFVPLGGNSHYALTSDWPSPSFDGNNLPSERSVTKSGFTAAWQFTKANLPFGTVLNNFKFDQSALAFGVTMIEPADQYAKTNRSIKYAILIIGLSFSLFFIIELMQNKPIHPVQYVLIGLALVIFYSLLLAISEFLSFDTAYLLAATATIGLIGLYSKAHFRSWRTAGTFSSVLTLLYGFIFVLIRLEDAALLVGSIGLFLILGLTMYASKKVDWYGTNAIPVQS